MLCKSKTPLLRVHASYYLYPRDDLNEMERKKKIPNTFSTESFLYLFS
jgi:hypothetical protein